MSIKESHDIMMADFKEFLICALRSDDVLLNISDIARVVGVDPSTMNRYINSPQSHMPIYLVPLLPGGLRSSILHWLDNKSGNPLKGIFDTSDLDGQVRDECDLIMESLGNVIGLERTRPGLRSKTEKIKLFQDIRKYALRAEQEINNRE